MQIWKLQYLQQTYIRIKESILFRPPVFLSPQLQFLCCYIARYYVKTARAPGVLKNISPLSWGPNQNRSELNMD